MRTESAVCWYLLIRVTSCTSGPVTRIASMLKAISPPMVSLPSNRSSVPAHTTTTDISFIRKPLTSVVSACTRPTSNCRRTACADFSSHFLCW
jgi:hypothetical protein